MNKLRDEQFLIVSGEKNKVLVFASNIGLECLSKCETWHANGTFYTAAKLFYQLYIVQGYFINKNSGQRFTLPCAYELMTEKTQESYREVIGSLLMQICV